MLFSGITFLYYFLPTVLLLYFLVPKKGKNLVLLLASLFFYGWGEPKYLLFMMISITQGYIFGLLIGKFRETKWSKVFLALTVLFSLGLLGYCKYTDFFIRNFNGVTGLSIPLLKIALPIGISFYTFQIISYTVDVYRGEVEAQKNYIDLAAYVAMFPQLIAGPIVRYSHIAKQLKDRTHDMDGIALGIRRFVMGLSKKILLANTLGELVSVFKQSDEKSVLFFWVYAVAYTLHIYFDFSGYSDMAIGLGRIFGFHFTENFDHPYVSQSITEFWRRWHISLGSWFRDYLYIPLGGNRVGKVRWFFNIFVVWMTTGFWHGAEWNFIIWGLMFAILLMVEKLWLLKPLKKWKGFNHVYVMFFVILSFVIFDTANVQEAFFYLKSMFGAGGFPLVSGECLYYLKSYGLIFLIALVGATTLPVKAVECIGGKDTGKKLLSFVEPIVLVLLLLICTGFLIDGSFNPFLYFRF